MNRSNKMHSTFLLINDSPFDIPTVIRIDLKIKKGVPKVKLLGNLTNQAKQEYQTYIAERTLFSRKTPLFRTVTIYIHNPMKQQLSRLPIEAIISTILALLDRNKTSNTQPKDQKLASLYTEIKNLSTPFYKDTQRSVLLVTHQHFDDLLSILGKRPTSYQQKRLLTIYAKIIPKTHSFIQPVHNFILIKAAQVPKNISSLALLRLLYITYGVLFTPPLIISTFPQTIRRLPQLPPLIILPTCLCANRFSHIPCICNNLQLKHYFARVLTFFESLTPKPKFYIFDASNNKLNSYKLQDLYPLYL